MVLCEVYYHTASTVVEREREGGEREREKEKEGENTIKSIHISLNSYKLFPRIFNTSMITNVSNSSFLVNVFPLSIDPYTIDVSCSL